ncbi:hypothetical protein NBH08_08365 [Faecalicatena sp. BF-R-105]|nr:hypothetical protein [Faecalicatena sp. BF-R-105]
MGKIAGSRTVSASVRSVPHESARGTSVVRPEEKTGDCCAVHSGERSGKASALDRFSPGAAVSPNAG